jgi:hypothetical protein
MAGVYGYVKSRHKLTEFMAAVTITINVMVMVAVLFKKKSINGQDEFFIGLS